MNKIAWVIFTLISLEIFAQEAKIKFDRTDIDLGIIDEKDAIINLSFPLKNKGNQDLEIISVNSSCWCIIVSQPEFKIKPDSSAVIKVSLNLKNRPGFFNKTISVITNTKPDITLLSIKGVVKVEPRNPQVEYPFKKGDLRFQSNGINIGTLTTEKPTERTIEIYNDSDQSILLLNTYNAPSYVKILNPNLVLKPREVSELIISYDAKAKNDYGFVSDYLEIHTNASNSKIIPISVFGSIEEFFPKLSHKASQAVPVLNLSKNEIYLGRYNNGTDIEGSVTLTNTGLNPLKILKIKPNCNCVTAFMPSDVIHKDESILLSFKVKTKDLVGANNKTIVVFTNDPANPVSIINIKFDVY